MKNNKERTPVVIIGAGIVGLHNANQLAKRGLEVVIIDDLKERKKSYKVGESLLIFSNMLLRTVNDLDDHFNKSIPKEGVWFVKDMEGAENFDQATEWAFERTIPQRWKDAITDKYLYRSMIDDVQIARPEVESKMMEDISANPLITFIDTARVVNVEIGEGDALNKIEWRDRRSKQSGEILSEWVIDCSGRTRFLSRKLDLIKNNKETADGFQTWAAWGQFSDIDDDKFSEVWNFKYEDGTYSKRDGCTMHLWGEGYWIWIIHLSENRVSIGVVTNQDYDYPGKDLKEKFWNIIDRYPLLNKVISEENQLEFNVYNDVQYIANSYVNKNRYGIVGDAASVIGAYYSQGISLALVSSWHLSNIIEEDLKEGKLDTQYIDRVNENTTQDWHIMRNMIATKFTSAIKDNRFFILSHFLDALVFTSIGLFRHQLVRWLVETDASTLNEKKVHTQMRNTLKERLFISKGWSWISSERIQKIQAKWQLKLAERANWRIEHGIETPMTKGIVRFAAGAIKFWRMPILRLGNGVDISPDAIESEPKFMLVTGKKVRPPALLIAKPAMLMIFLIMYFQDWFGTMFYKVRYALGWRPEKKEQSETVPKKQIKQTELVKRN